MAAFFSGLMGPAPFGAAKMDRLEPRCCTCPSSWPCARSTPVDHEMTTTRPGMPGLDDIVT